MCVFLPLHGKLFETTYFNRRDVQEIMGPVKTQGALTAQERNAACSQKISLLLTLLLLFFPVSDGSPGLLLLSRRNIS